MFYTNQLKKQTVPAFPKKDFMGEAKTLVKNSSILTDGKRQTCWGSLNWRCSAHSKSRDSRDPHWNYQSILTEESFWNPCHAMKKIATAEDKAHETLESSSLTDQWV